MKACDEVIIMGDGGYDSSCPSLDLPAVVPASHTLAPGSAELLSIHLGMNPWGRFVLSSGAGFAAFQTHVIANVALSQGETSLRLATSASSSSATVRAFAMHARGS